MCIRDRITAAGAYVITKKLVRISSLVSIKMDGNMINERGLEELTSLCMKHHKVLVEMEDNDDEGDDDIDDVLDQEEDDAEDEELVKGMAAL